MLKPIVGMELQGGINALVLTREGVPIQGFPCDRFDVHYHGHTQIGWNGDLLDREFSSLWVDVSRVQQVDRKKEKKEKDLQLKHEATRTCRRSGDRSW